jgi:hypothetical protein
VPETEGITAELRAALSAVAVVSTGVGCCTAGEADRTVSVVALETVVA